MNAGILFIVAAPSGAGKSTLVNAVLERDWQLKLSISYTTRPPRPGEEDGREYHFVSRAQFAKLSNAGEFLESAEVHGNLYATSRAQIAAGLAAGQDIILEIDWQGAQQVRQLFAENASIFILPPSLPELERRLRDRGKDSEVVIQRRMAAARSEIEHAGEFDYAIINKDFDVARRDLEAVVRAARLTVPRQKITHPDWFSARPTGAA